MRNEIDDRILMEETRRVIGKIKCGKAGGVCDIRGEMLKAGGEVTVQWLTAIFNVVWRTGVTPKEWRRAIIIPVYKKGNKRVCKNYRGISLLSVPGKVLGKILNDRMRSITEGRIMEEQVGFRPGRGCMENVFVIRQLAEKMLERGKRLYAAFLDLDKAYDRVWRTGLWEALKQYGVEGRLLKAVQGLYKDSEATVKVGEEMTDWFEVQRGVRQGCPMSPWLFNIYLDRVLKEALPLFRGGAGLNNCQIQVTMFADDTVLLAESEEELKWNVEKLHEAMKKHKLKVNWSKSNTMVFSRVPTECNIEIDGEKVKNVTETVYLGVKLSEDGKMGGELERRIGMTMQTVGAMKKVYESREISRETKVTVFEAVAIPTLTYGCEVWVLTKKEKSRLQATEMRMLRKIAGVSRLDHVRNETVRERLRLELVLKKVERRRECWKENVESRKGSVVAKVLAGEGVGKRPRGRPKKRWRDPF